MLPLFLASCFTIMTHRISLGWRNLSCSSAEEGRAFYNSTFFTYIPSIPIRIFSDIDRGAPSLPDAWWSVEGRDGESRQMTRKITLIHLQDWGAFDDGHRAQSIPAPIMRHYRDQGQIHREDLWQNERRWWWWGGSRWTQVPVEASFQFSKNASPSGKPTPRSCRLCYPPSLARIPSGSVALPEQRTRNLNVGNGGLHSGGYL